LQDFDWLIFHKRYIYIPTEYGYWGVFMKSLFISILLLFAVSSQAAVWDSAYTWDQRWEQQYSDWVKNSWDQYIFTDKNSPYFGIPTDCADASYAMRAIFAFENSLPFAIVDPTRSSTKPVSNKMGRWNKLPAGVPRLKAFIGYLSAIIYTGSMPDDTVPVALNSASLIPGIVYVKPRVHSYQIKDWSPQGIPVTINSTTPYSVKDMHKYLSFPAYIPEDIKTFSDGYRRFKRPNELYKMTSTLPGFSLEQYRASKHYEFNSVDFNDYVISRTQTEQETVEDKTRRLMFNICYSSYNRASVIDESTAYFNKIRATGRSCMNASEFDQYSTFSRDKRLKEYFIRLGKYVDSTKRFKGKRFPLKAYATDLFESNPKKYRRTREQFLKFCTVPYKRNRVLDVRQVWQRVERNLIVQNPNTTNDWRWGDYNRQFTTNCPTFEEIH